MKKQGPFLHELMIILNMDESEQLVIGGAHTKTLTRILDDDGSELSAQMGSATGIDLADADQLSEALGPINAALVGKVSELTGQLNESSEVGRQLQQQYEEALQREQSLVEAVEIGEQQRLADIETIADLRAQIAEMQQAV